MQVRYSLPLVVALLLAFGVGTAQAQTVIGFEVADGFTTGNCNPSCTDNSGETVWVGGTISNAGPLGQIFQPVNAAAAVTFPLSEGSSISFIFRDNGTTSTAEAFDGVDGTNCDGSMIDMVDSVNDTTPVSFTASGIRCVQFNLQPGGVLQVDDFTVTFTALAVELADFTATNSDGTVSLAWSTFAEKDNAGFEVQQRVDGEFARIGYVEGMGTSTEVVDYRHDVTDLTPGTHAFRLKMIDLDGTFTYSPVVEVAVDVPGAYHLSAAYPNPFNPQTQFSLSIARAQQVSVGVYDLLGRQVAQLFNGIMEADQAVQFQFEAANLPSGLYVIRAAGEDFVAARQVTLLK